MALNSSDPVYQRPSSLGDTHLKQMEELHQFYYNPLLSYGLVITGQRELVKDAVQDLFLWLLTKPQRLKEISNIEAYLFTALRRNLKGNLKSRGVVRSLSEETDVIEAVDLQVPAVDNQFIARERQEHRRKILTKEIDALPDRLREALFLRYFTQLSYKEIAEVMAIKPQVAKNFVSRALLKLRNSLSKCKQLLTYLPLLLSGIY